MRPNTPRAIAIALAVGCATPTATPGTLSPPSGPVQPTHKTLDQVNPSTPVHPDFLAGDATAVFIIREPGAYHLVTDVDGEVSKHGIRIESSDVTLDLSGFNVRGVEGSLSGIFVDIDRENDVLERFGIVVKGHGRVFGWGQHGLAMGDAQRSRVEDVIATNNTLTGIDLGDGCTALRCTTESNALDGIRAGDDARIIECVCNANSGGAGINAQDRAHITGCSASLNAEPGISAGDGASIANCLCSNNKSGIEVNNDATISGCTTHFNAEHGVVGNRDLLVERCHARENGITGFSVQLESTFRACRAFENGADGFRVEFRKCHFTNCTSAGHAQNGFQIGEDSSITACYAEGNHYPGIAAFDRCTIVGNTLISHLRVGGGNSGIAVLGDRCRVEDNHIVTADEGISVTGTNNVVVKNSVSDCPAPYTNIDPGNRVGTISTTPAGAGAWDNFQEF